MLPHKQPLLVVVGPTASGKTELAIRLAEAVGGEVINADSVQIYQHFDIGSGKPTAEEQARVPHHLMSILDPLEEVDAARFAELAESAVSEIECRGKRPIVCGGTFLWVRALLYGLAAAPKADSAVRAMHKTIAETEGRDALHRRLMSVDPLCASRLSPNDFVRVSRALEVHELTGIPMSQWQADHGFREAKRPFRLLSVTRERAEMDDRILRRAASMLDQGFVEEVVGLCERGYGAARAMSSVGYREVKAAVDLRNLTHENVALSDIAKNAINSTIEACDGSAKNTSNRAPASAKLPTARELLRDAIAQKTRVFARRQRTWLRDEPITWVSPELITDNEQLQTLCSNIDHS